MRGRMNTTGVEEGTGFRLPPEGDYMVEIVEVGEKNTKNGDPMAMLTLEIKTGEYKGCKIWDNIVIPLPSSPSIAIMGRTKHFLHCIGEQYNGEFEYDTERWKLKKVNVTVKQEIQEQGKYAGKHRCVIADYILDESLNRSYPSGNEATVWDDTP